MRNPALSGQPPKQTKAESGQQQTKAARHAPAAIQQPNAPHSQASKGCPGTQETRFDCNTVATIANVRQADAAERFNNLAGLEIGIGFATAVAAILAARWAKQAAHAGTNSYKAFVAAEDAHLVLDFEQGPVGQWTIDGVTKVNYSFKVTVTNVGRSAARVQRVIFSNADGALARSFGKTLKVDASMELLDDWLMILADNPRANVQVSYATSLHPLTTLDVTVGMDVAMGGQKATAYLVRSRTGRPKTK